MFSFMFLGFVLFYLFVLSRGDFSRMKIYRKKVGRGGDEMKSRRIVVVESEGRWWG